MSAWKVFLPPVVATTIAFLVALTLLDLSQEGVLGAPGAGWTLLAAAPYRLAWAFGFSLLPGGIILARAGYRVSTTAWIAVISAAAVLILEAGVSPYLSDVLSKRLLTAGAPISSMGLGGVIQGAAALRDGVAPQGLAGIAPEFEARMLLFGATVPFLRVVLCLLSVACGYMAASRLRWLPLARTAWVLLVVINGAFVLGVRYGMKATLLGAAQNDVVFFLPLAVPLAVLGVLALLEFGDQRSPGPSFRGEAQA